MLHDQHGVAGIAQLLQGLQQAIHIPGVQPHTGFVQHVEHLGHTRTQDRAQAQALELAAGQGVGPPVQLQVPEPQLVQDIQTPPDLRRDGLAHLLPGPGEGQPGEQLRGRRDGKGGHRRDGVAVGLYRQGLGHQARPLADLAGRIPQPLFQPGQLPGSGLAAHPLEPAVHPDEPAAPARSLP